MKLQQKLQQKLMVKAEGLYSQKIRLEIMAKTGS